MTSDVRSLTSVCVYVCVWCVCSKWKHVLNFLVNAALVIAPIYVAITVDSFPLRMLCAIVMGLGFTQFGWTAHDYGHHQVFKNRMWNDMMLLASCVFIGFDREWWSLKHNTHHAIPNVHESTEDAHGTHHMNVTCHLC